jgi:hypothetical protein
MRAMSAVLALPLGGIEPLLSRDWMGPLALLTLLCDVAKLWHWAQFWLNQVPA